MNTGDLILRDIQTDVDIKMNISGLFITFCPIGKERWNIVLRRSVLNQVRSSQRFVLSVTKSYEIVLSPTTSEKRTRSETTEASDIVTDLSKIVEEEEEDGEN